MRIDHSVKHWFHIGCILVLLPLSNLALSNINSTDEINFEGGANICFPFEGPGGCGWNPDPVFPLPGQCAIIYTPNTESPLFGTFPPYYYSLSSDSYSGLSIDPNNGDVTLCADEELFEQTSSISFDILITDSVGNMFSQTVTLSIPYYDTTPPQFNLICINIDENSGAGQVVCQVEVDDSGDIIDGVIFSLTNDSDPALTINAVTGEVILTVDPDYEVQNIYSLAVIATDAAGNLASESAVFSINDLDDFPPMVSLSCNDLEENSGSWQVVCQAIADDSADISGGVTFSLTDDSDPALTINDVTGEVYLTVDPDYEVQSEYFLTVIATDAAANSASVSGQFSIYNIDESKTPIAFSFTSNAFGFETLGIGCEISLIHNDSCDTPGDLINTQAVYVASSTIAGSQKVITVGYASDDATTAGIGFNTYFDSEKLTLVSVTDVRQQDLFIFPSFENVSPDNENLDENSGINLYISAGWMSIFEHFPGTSPVNLYTLIFNINQIEPRQLISVNNTPKGVLGRTSVLEVSYDTTDSNNQLSGLGMRVHFDSSLLSFKEITGLIEQDIIVSGEGPFSDDADFDNDPLTDQYMLFGWASLHNNWPNTELPTVLMNIAFDVSENIDTDAISSTSINFTNTSFTAGYEFSAENFNLELLRATWDFDGNGQADALTDGLMMLRYLFGLRGDLVTNDAMAESSPLTSEQVVGEIEAAMDIMDIDADGNNNALTDGLMLLRYLFDLRDDSLTSGAVGPEATRTSNADIQSYLDSYMPSL